jgi:hypothetical protein
MARPWERRSVLLEDHRAICDGRVSLTPHDGSDDQRDHPADRDETRSRPSFVDDVAGEESAPVPTL